MSVPSLNSCIGKWMFNKLAAVPIEPEWLKDSKYDGGATYLPIMKRFQNAFAHRRPNAW